MSRNIYKSQKRICYNAIPVNNSQDNNISYLWTSLYFLSEITGEIAGYSIAAAIFIIGIIPLSIMGFLNYLFHDYVFKD